MTEAVQQTLDNYFTAWNRLEFASLADFWQQDGDVYYVAEEIERPMHSFNEILSYWRKTAATITSIDMQATDLRIRLLADNIAVATYEMHVDAGVQHSATIGIDVRVSAILRNTGQGWRFIHYAESALGALPFVRRAYAANVRDQ